jgi:hypothetical protein
MYSATVTFTTHSETSYYSTLEGAAALVETAMMYASWQNASVRNVDTGLVATFVSDGQGGWDTWTID